MAEDTEPKPEPQKDENELTDEEMEKVAGGFAPQPEPPKVPREVGNLPKTRGF